MTNRRGRGTPTLVALHGHGDDAGSARQWAEKLAPSPGWRIEVPEAPAGDDGVRSWFDTTPRGADPGSLRRSRDQVAAVVARFSTAGPVVVAGFSQGGALALTTGDLAGVDAVVAVCAFLPELDDHDLSRGAPVLVVSASADDEVPAFLGEDAATAMGAQGRRVTCRTLDGGHGVSDEAADVARSWLELHAPGRVRVTLGLPTDRVDTGEEFVSGEAISQLAAAWERLGFHAAWVTDHPAPDDRWLAGGGHQALEPTVALATAAAATTTLRLHTHIYVLGYRNPFLAAKSLASLDVVSGGRLILGVAAGYLRAEFNALGARFDDRADLLDQSLQLLGRIWTEDGVQVEADSYSARSVTALPRPVQRPGPPIWIGGNSEKAMRRAVAHGDGWSPFPTSQGLARATRTAAITDLDGLRSRIDRLAELSAEAGRHTPPEVCFATFSGGGNSAHPARSLEVLGEEASQLWDAGVDWLALAPWGDTRAEVTERAAEMSEVLGLA